ncbi:MAG TPA: DUF92 domain-containing protein [Terriglobales bacterium]|nr:DUF92 domain-containing protein [Terriglobales bacterium]
MAFAFPQPLWASVVVTLVFALLARCVRGVNISGAVAGAFVCFVLYASAGPPALAALITVFILTWIATRYGYSRKRALGTAENREGRTASQVLANLLTAALFAAVSALTGRTIFLVATAAAFSEAAADTVSSELGQINNQEVHLVTTWEIVPAGTDGGISATGTAAGIAAAIIVCGVCSLSRLVSLKWAVFSLIAGVAGMMLDSYLGASLERRKLLNNNGVNFLSTLAAAAIALLLAIR